MIKFCLKLGALSMLAKQIRKKFTRQFISFSKRGNFYSGVVFSVYILQFIGLITLGAYLLGIDIDYKPLYLAIIIFLIATRFRVFNNIIHECMHYSFCKTRNYNILYGKIAASLIFTSYYDYKAEHTSHHQNLGHREKDLDFHGRQKFGFEDQLSTKVVLKHIFTPIFGLHFPQYFSFNMTFKDGFNFGILKLLYFVPIIALAYFNIYAVLLFVILPFIWIFPAVNYWTDCVDHAGRIAEGDDLYKSRNYIMSKAVRWMFFPRNDCFHLIHHLFPSIPVYHMEAAHKELLTDSDYLAVSKYGGNIPNQKIVEVE